MKKYVVTFTVPVYANDEYEAQLEAVNYINECTPYIEEVSDDDNKPEMVDIYLSDLTVAAQKIIANVALSNYDILPITSILAVDPEGNYETFVLAYLPATKDSRITLTYADLSDKAFERLGWKGRKG